MQEMKLHRTFFVQAGIEYSIVIRLLSRYSLLRRWAHGGSLLQMCAPKGHTY